MSKVTYKDSGVNIEEGYEAVKKINSHVKRTHNEGVLNGIGNFSGMFMPNLRGYKNPVLVSGTDGVGTKLKLANYFQKHDEIGKDLVAMCVNDILCQGASPMFFLDYIATGKLDSDRIEEIVRGISDGCILGKMALIGGETAEMPGMYGGDDYDLAGFAVGIVNRDKIITGQDISEGDIAIGLKSSGIHSNGYSLVRKIFFEDDKDLKDKFMKDKEYLKGILLEPTRIYADIVGKIISKIEVKGMAHITGGGFYENIPRMLPEGIGLKVDRHSWDIPEVFEIIKREGNLEDKDMFSTFNMGIGMVMVIKRENLDSVKGILEENSEDLVLLGDLIRSEEAVIL